MRLIPKEHDTREDYRLFLLGELGDRLAAPVLREGILTPKRDPVPAEEQAQHSSDERTASPVGSGFAKPEGEVGANLERRQHVLVGDGEDGNARRGVRHPRGLLRGVGGPIGDEGGARGELASHLRARNRTGRGESKPLNNNNNDDTRKDFHHNFIRYVIAHEKRRRFSQGVHNDALKHRKGARARKVMTR